MIVLNLAVTMQADGPITQFPPPALTASLSGVHSLLSVGWTWGSQAETLKMG
jgi:hypothetical protein